jgi:hypothetical protein
LGREEMGWKARLDEKEQEQRTFEVVGKKAAFCINSFRLRWQSSIQSNLKIRVSDIKVEPL